MIDLNENDQKVIRSIARVVAQRGPEYTTPGNPILWLAREYRADRLAMRNPKGWAHIARKVEQYVAAHPGKYTPEQIDHARKVLERLAALS